METEPSYTKEENISTAHNEANFINAAIDDKVITTEQANEIIFEQLLPDILSTKMFVELPQERLDEVNKTQGEALRDLLNEKGVNNQTVLERLEKNNVSLAIAMQEGFDKDPLMVESFKKLNESGIKPTLWLVLDDTLGYWTNKANVEESMSKLELMLKWARGNDIEIEKVGLDYEPPIELLRGLMNLNIPKSIKETYKYITKAIENHKELGNLQWLIDSKLEEIMNRYDIGIETYAAMEPLRSLSNLLTFKPNPKSKTVTMAYTSVHKKGTEKSELSNSKVKEGITNTLSRIDEDEIPALGIIGSNPMKTPGKDLRENKDGEKEPEKHLTLEELTYNFNQILVREKPFRTHNVFALDSAETLNMVLKAREDGIKER
jgi:hypothetical protein